MKETYKGYDLKNDLKIPTVIRLSVSGDGGSLPKALQGLYTDTRAAKRDIDAYLGSNETLKEKVRARKTTAASTS